MRSWRLRTITIAWSCPDCRLEGEIRLPGAALHFHELSGKDRALISVEAEEQHQQAHFRRSQGQAPTCRTVPIWSMPI